MSRLAHFARDLQGRLERLFDTSLGPDATPLEISQAVIDDVERKLQPVGRGRKTLPYHRVLVRVKQTNGERAPLEAVFAGLGDRLRVRLGELGCDIPQALDVKVLLLKKAPPEWSDNQWFAVEYHAPAQHTHPPDTPPACSVNITVVKGATARKTYSFTEPVISIGRTPDPTDEEGRIRRNRIAFLDTTDGITETVGRVHAHLRFDRTTRDYRLFDDGSSNGTSIVRDGAAIPVPPRDPRGVRVMSGDEIQVGRALLRIAIGNGPPAQGR